MPPTFEILDAQPTPLGELILRRRRILSLETEVYEVKLGDAFLMSSLFITVEVALAELGLAACVTEDNTAPGPVHDIVVGGLGLGYTARAALDHPASRSVLVIEALPPVLDWHRRGLVPLGAGLAAHPACRFIEGDFFALAAAGRLDPDRPGRLFDAVLLDIDHSPRNLLSDRHREFYQPAGLASLARQLRPGGVFALWSDDPPDDDFTNQLGRVFGNVVSHVVSFDNPVLGEPSRSSVYVTRRIAHPPAAS